jgi:hypothetical protein
MGKHRMKVERTNLDGRRTEPAELHLGDGGRLWLNDTLVQGAHVVGNRVALRVLGRQICISGADYQRLVQPEVDALPPVRSRRR